MNATLLQKSWRADFPGIADWHYLDTAATAQKPAQAIEAIARAYGEDYATVHRGVYARSANMTLAYEAARRKVAGFINAYSDAEVVYTRGATEAINLVAHSWGGTNLKEGDRIMLSVLEHHSNIVPWQMIAERTGAQIDVAPLTEDGKVDLDVMQAMLTSRHKIVALAHVSNTLGSVLDARRAVLFQPRAHFGAERALLGRVFDGEIHGSFLARIGAAERPHGIIPAGGIRERPVRSRTPARAGAKLLAAAMPRIIRVAILMRSS